MGRSKRPLPEDFKTAGSTDDLCRAVKRLHTYSQDASCNTASKQEGDLVGGGDEEASSSLQNSEPGLSKPQPDAEARGGGQPRGGAASIPMERGDAHWRGKSRRDLPSGLNTDIDEGDEDDGRQQEGDVWLEEGVREGLANINVTRGMQREGSVPQPSTPSREEGASPSVKKGHRLGTRESGGGHGYDELYEEANNLLKNLHFEWLHRQSGQN